MYNEIEILKLELGIIAEFNIQYDFVNPVPNDVKAGDILDMKVVNVSAHFYQDKYYKSAFILRPYALFTFNEKLNEIYTRIYKYTSVGEKDTLPF